MTADEIRRFWTPGAVQREDLPNLQAELLQELTAQLAELNAMLKGCLGTASGINVTLCASTDTIPVSIR